MGPGLELARPPAGSYAQGVPPRVSYGPILGLVLLIAIGGTRRAHADDAAEAKELATRAVTAAGEGRKTGDRARFAEAIALFKQAFRLDPDPEYQCNIGIAYRDHEDLAQAHLYLGRCIARMGAASADRKSALRTVHAALENKLRAAGHVPVDIATRPAGAVVRVSAFAADDTFPAPWQVWLPPGNHTISASAGGFAAVDEQVSVQAGAPSVSVSIVLSRETAPVIEPPVTIEPPVGEPARSEPAARTGARPGPMVDTSRPAPRKRGVAYALLGIGAAGLAGGAMFHVFAYRNIGRIEDEDLRGAEYDDVAGTIRTQRALAIGLYALGAVGAGAGVYLAFGRGRSETRVSIAPAPSGTGGVAWISFER